MHGWVRTFIADRGFGSITGDDGQEYFFHLDDVTGRGTPSTGQAVSFTPGRTAKGLRARSVAVSGHAPQGRQVYLDPDHFIMTRAPEVRGFVIVQVLSPDAWGESNDPNEARDILRQEAERLGANAVVGLTLYKYTKNETCSNYRYTMHRFSGRPSSSRRPATAPAPRRSPGPGTECGTPVTVRRGIRPAARRWSGRRCGASCRCCRGPWHGPC